MKYITLAVISSSDGALLALLGLFYLGLWVLPIVRAFSLEKTLKAQRPHTKSFKWGFFIGSVWKLQGITFSLLMLGAAAYLLLLALSGGVIQVEEDVVKGNEAVFVSIFLFFFAGWFGFAAIAGHYMLKRKRWAFIAITVFQGPFWWIINGIYLKNRWDELTGEASETRSSLEGQRVAAYPEPDQGMAQSAFTQPPGKEAPPVFGELVSGQPLSEEIPTAGLPLPSYTLLVMGENRGPFLVDQIRQMSATGQLPPNCQYWCEKTKTWQSIMNLI